MRAFNCTAVVLLVLAGGAPAFAVTPPDRVNYQGVLRNADGVPRNGDHDMVFRFYDSAVGGNEILVDSHIASGSGAVAVTGGLFTVPLGGGDVDDGAGVFPDDPYLSLTKMFSDFSEVWLQIEVDSGDVLEVLSPRVAILSSPYGLNRSATDDVELFLDGTTGHGSINTRVIRWANIRKNTLAAHATYTDSPTAGMSITVAIPGVYAFEIAQSDTGSTESYGITVNEGATLSTDISSLGHSDGVRIRGRSGLADHDWTISGVIRLSAGDVVRAHDQGGSDGPAPTAYFKMIRIGD